ncbi:MAG: flippase [Richelia sp. SL_2_1]|nr:flippase [Richelia sp. SM2_1_7]NJM19761.1 flippase [Richelia sp. SM1_7_0]NJN08020.1 flippase [Richelia sp. RM1_1_1]NJO27820.1 flippase [Richelia sp. SL_2_1]
MKGFLIRGAGWSVFARITTTGLSFVISILLARLFSVKDYGGYQYIMGWSALLNVPAGLGLAEVITREVASSSGDNRLDRVEGIVKFSYISVLVSSFTIAAIVALIITAYPGREWELFPYFLLSLLFLPIQSCLGVSGAIQTGQKKIVLGSLPLLVNFSLFAGTLVTIWAFIPVNDLKIDSIIRIKIICAIVALALALVLAYRSLKLKEITTDYKPTIEAVTWLKAGLSLVLMAEMHTINNQADILMLGISAGSENVGIYHAATRLAFLLNFALAAVLVPMKPLISEFFASGQMERLQALVTRTTRLVFTITLLIALVYIVFGNKLLTLLYNPQYASGATALSILTVAQLFNVGMGPVAAILVMTGNEKVAAVGVMISTGINVSLNALLIPRFGIQGAAFATGTSFVVWNTLLMWETRRRLRLHPTIFGKLF